MLLKHVNVAMEIRGLMLLKHVNVAMETRGLFVTETCQRCYGN